MKKIILTLLLAVSVLTLAACDGNNTEAKDEITVVFFSSNNEGDSYARQRNLQPGDLITEPVFAPTDDEDNPNDGSPYRKGYTFNGWYTEYTAENLWDFDTDTVGEESIVLYAGWTPDLHNIIYQSILDNEDERITAQVYLTEFYSGESGVLPIAAKTGFEFVAWYTYPWLNEAGEVATIPGDSGYQIIPDGQVEDLVLYAHWEPISVRVTFKINYPIDGEGPENINPVLFPYGDPIDFTVLDDTAEYRFLGWNTKSDGTGTFYNNGDIFERTQRITLYGTWELID